MRGLQGDTPRIRACVLVVATFTLGEVGALLFKLMQERTSLVPAALTGRCGLGYTSYRYYRMSMGRRPGAR